jgi:hypothetical protein
MNMLKSKELDKDDDIYNMIFNDTGSDEEFNPDVEKNSEDSFASDFGEANENSEEKSEEIIKIDDRNDRRKRILDDEIIDLDDLDIDKIDELEDFDRDVNDIPDDDIDDEDESEEFEEKKKPKKTEIKKHNKLGLGNDKPKRISKKFIDYEDDDDMKRTKKRKITFKPPKKTIKKSRFDNNIDRIPRDGKDDENNLMEYNNEQFEAANKEFEEETKKEKSKQSNLKSYTAEKPTQQDLLFEAIFTEIYNKKSLEELQKLEDLNKKDFTTSSKKQFTDYIRTSKKFATKGNNY